MSTFRPSNVPAAALVLACAVLTACGGGSDGGGGPPPPPPTTYSAASGVAQKGPLATGSAVTMRELGLNLAVTGPTHTATTDSDLGTFNPGTTFATPYVGVSATGFYRDEITDAPSDGPITLQSYADLGVDTTLNANLLTTLAYGRIERLVNLRGLAFADARAQAEREVLAAFGIAVTPAVAHFGALDIADAGAAGTATDGDRMLAALSAVFVQGRSSADVAALIAAVQADVAANGAITDPATRASIAASAQALDLDRAAANLSRLYAPAVIAPTALAEWLDRDGDGVVGHDEFVDAGGSGSVTLPADFAAAHAGATVTASAGADLWINGAPVAAPATLRAGDVVALVEPATPPQGVFKAWLNAGTTPIARVVFVNGLVGIAVTPAAGTVPAGLTQHFAATGTFGDGHTEDLSGAVAWSSDTPGVADIDAGSGDADALAAGSATITASVGPVSGSTSLGVIAAAIRSIAIAPGTLTTGVGVTRTLVATGTFTDGSVANVSASVTWTSLSTATATVLHGRVTGVALGSTSVTASFGDASASATVDVTTDTWTPAATMPTSRIAGASVTTLADGSVLVIGGAGDGAAGTTAVDLYDPLAGRWLAAGTRAAMTTARSAHTATLLADGRVLVAGGSSPGGSLAQGYTNNTSAEIYDPARNAWTSAAPMTVARAHHTATLLANGQVLVTGGEDDHYVPVASAELYDPVADAWTPVQSPMASPRSTQTATLLPGGQVLVAGGFDIVAGVLTPLAVAELYDPVLGAFTAAAPTSLAHAGHTATMLADGRVLVAGGGNGQAELYDPATGQWLATPGMASARTGQAAVLLPWAQVLLAGGTQAAPNAEHYDVAGGLWTAASAMSVNRPTPLAALLPDGSVLVCGGAAGAASTSCETWW
jgi:hypothetical protein